jgi:hydroxymethylpyrimidine/phosphomethylpyrimidine kinase
LEFSNEAIDFLYDGKTFTEFRTNRIDTRNTHGTGCTYASAISAEIAKGLNIIDAIHVAKSYLTAAIARSNELNLGNGHGPVDHFQDNNVGVNLDLVKVSKNVDRL